MPDLVTIHDELFNYLMQWSENSRYTDSVENPYFYFRGVEDTLFQKGYWFPGNEEFICLSFWTGGDSLNKTPNIFFEINKVAGCRSFIVARDSEEKAQYFKQLVDALQTKGLGYRQIGEGAWMQVYGSDFKDYKVYLDAFISQDKFLIDAYIRQQDPRKYIGEFASPFGFIQEQDFENHYSRVRHQKSYLETVRKIRLVEHKANANLASVFNDQLLQQVLPYSLKNIDIKNYQGIRKTLIDNLPDYSQWIFITGENGYGKTSLLQAIALGLCNDRSLDVYLQSETRIEICIQPAVGPVDTLIRLKSTMSGNYENQYDQLVIAYGPVRLNTHLTESRNISESSSNHVMSLFNSMILLKNIKYELFAKKHTNEVVFQALEQAVREATDGRIDGIEFNEEEVLFREKLSNGEILPAIPLEKLAAGFRSIINIVGDIIVRFGTQASFISYKEFAGLVLIDEIENHLHPILQREIPIALSRVFPKIQFIATTHSPIPLLGAPKQAVILTVTRNLEEGIIIERLDEQIDFGNLLPNTILSSPIFGFDNIIPNANTDLAEIHTSSQYTDAIELESLKQSLNLKKIDVEAIRRNAARDQM